MPRRRFRALLLVPWALLLVSGAALSGAAEAAPPRPLVVAVLGSAADAGRLSAAALGARLAAEAAPREGPLAGGVRIESLDDGATAAGLKAALKRARALDAALVLALPSGDLDVACWDAAGGLKVPWVTLTGRSPDRVRAPEYLLHLGPTPVAHGIAAAAAMLAPLAARRVAVLHEPSAWGRDVGAAFARNLSAQVAFAGALAWDPAVPDATLRSLRALEAEWVFVALGGASLHAFAAALAASDWRPRLLLADGARDASLLAEAGAALEDCVVLDGPNPEMHGRLGERLVDGVERSGTGLEAVTARAFEAVRRVLAAITAAGSTRLKHVWTALDPATPWTGALGTLVFEPHGAVRDWPLTVWRVRKGRWEEWAAGLRPVPGCGPPLGFGLPRTARLHPKGKLCVVTWGEGGKRTIERDLHLLGLSTGGAQPDLDARVREEIQGRAIRIANRLFRREADGTPIPGWSFGVAFSTKPPGEEVKTSQRWLAVCAGDHEAAGGQAFGTWVAVYTTFLRRTMYQERKLDPPLTDADRPLLDGSYRWGEDRSLNFRADKLRCLMDGFASAMGLTLSHELGHLCGCGHDTEHPTSIMNVVAGAGASWEDAVWIPRHERSVGTTLGLEGLPGDE